MTSPARSLLLAAAILAICPPAIADEAADRYRAASEAQAAAMTAFLVSRVPDMAEVVPSPEWTDEHEAIAACTLDALRAERGEEGVEAYVAAMEEAAAIEVTSLDSMASGPALLADELAVRLLTECGGMDLAARQMEESGFMEMMMRPGVMEALLAP